MSEHPTKESGRLSETAEWHSVAYLRQAYLDMKAERDALREEVENWRNGMIEQSVKRHVAEQKARPDMRQSDPTKQSEVEGTVPSQWYLDIKAERDALREALCDILDVGTGWVSDAAHSNPVPYIIEIATKALERPE